MIRVGQRLYEERVKKRLTIEQVAKETKIRAEFLRAIEKSDFKKLPSGAYIQGFVKNYADFLGLPKREFAALFRREFNEREYLDILPEGLAQNQDIPLNRIRVGLKTIIGIFMFLVLLGYLIFQYRYAIVDPPLDISYPTENQEISQNITVLGKTQPNATVVVNDNPVTVDPDGSFKKTITLFPGRTTILVKVKNTFGKQTQVERHVDVKPQT